MPQTPTKILGAAILFFGPDALKSVAKEAGKARMRKSKQKRKSKFNLGNLILRICDICDLHLMLRHVMK